MRYTRIFIVLTICTVAIAILCGSQSPLHSASGQRWKKPTESSVTAATSEGLANLEAQAKVDPYDHELWQKLGSLYFDNGEHHKAIEAYRTSLKLYPENSDVLSDLGIMYRQSGAPQKAIEAFDRALAVDPDHYWSLFNKGVVLHYDLGKTEDAVRCWQGVLDIKPEFKLTDGRPLREVIDQFNASKGQ